MSTFIFPNKRQELQRFRSVVVITCASHAQGPRFDPGRKHLFTLAKIFTYTIYITKSSNYAFHCQKNDISKLHVITTTLI